VGARHACSVHIPAASHMRSCAMTGGCLQGGFNGRGSEGMARGRMSTPHTIAHSRTAAREGSLARGLQGLARSEGWGCGRTRVTGWKRMQARSIAVEGAGAGRDYGVQGTTVQEEARVTSTGASGQVLGGYGGPHTPQRKREPLESGQGPEVLN